VKYGKQNATGDAGEYYFAYTVARKLRWPCRLLDIDLGVDAQIEALDINGQSTGNFIAVQVKSTEDKALMSLYISLRHVEYWQGMETPVLIALVNLATNKIFLHQINKSNIYCPATNGGDTTKITFNQVDRLSEKSIPLLRIASYVDRVMAIRAGISKIDSECCEILKVCDLGEAHRIADHRFYLELMDSFSKLPRAVLDLKSKVTMVRDKAGDCGYPAAIAAVQCAHEALCTHFKYFDMSYQEEQLEIKQFREQNFYYLELDR
jgi:hypothetical protein